VNKYFLHGKITAKKGEAENLALILLEAAKILSTFEGCLLYVIGKDEKEEHSVWVTELWNSKEDHDNSLKLQDVRDLISKALSIIEGQPTKGQELKIIGGKGIS